MVDEKYLDHPLYDLGSYSWCKAVDKSGEITLVDLDSGEEYASFDYEDFGPVDLVRVEERAIEEPVKYIDDILDEVAAGDFDGLSGSLSEEEKFSLRYARKLVDIVPSN